MVDTNNTEDNYSLSPNRDIFKTITMVSDLGVIIDNNLNGDHHIWENIIKQIES